ncbi:hypothetical protein D3C78_1155320 [compost metagenome]
MPAALAAQTAATTTATAVKSAGDTATAAATGSAIGGYGDVSQGQNPCVENPPGHRARGTVATITTRARHQAPGDHQTIERHDFPRRYFNHSGPVLTIESHVSRVVVVQVAINGDVLVNQQFGRQLHRHAAVKGDDVAVLRRGDGGTQ